MMSVETVEGSLAVAQKPRLWWLPKEHGAYAQLGFPLITAVALANPSGAQFFWVTAALAVFLAHEPLLILTGERGRRSRAQLATRARSTAVFLLVLAIGAGVLGWWSAPGNARLAVLVPIGLGAVLAPLIVRHREKTLWGELLASVTFSSLAIPLALAGGASLGAALIASAVWCAVFSLSTLTVRATIARVKRVRGGRRTCCTNLLLSIAVTLAAIFLTRSGDIPVLAAAALLPAAVIAATFSIVEVHTRHLRTMGWSLVATNVITLIALLAGLR